MKIKAAILFEQKKPLIIDEIELKDSLSFGQVLVKLKHSGICGSQIGEINGTKGVDKYLPHLLGHEGSAEVVDIGPGVTKVKIDDFVVLHWKQSAGLQCVQPKYLLGKKQINAGWVTTFNDYAVISENRLTKVSKEFDPKVLSLFGCAITTGFGAIENNGNTKIGQSIFIFGAGGVGLNMIQAAKILNCYPIIACDIFDNRLELAKKIGATHVFNISNINLKELQKHLPIKNFDLFIDNTGNPDVINFGYQIINNEGKLILVGVPKLDNETKIYTLPLHFGKQIIGSHGGSTIPDKDIPRLLNLVKNRNINFNEIITEEFDLEDINNAIKRMQNGDLSGRCVINF